MLEIVGGIILEGLKIFPDERRRYYERRYYQLLKEEQDALNAVYPYYSDHAVQTVQKEIKIFTTAYQAELAGVIKDVKSTLV